MTRPEPEPSLSPALSWLRWAAVGIFVLSSALNALDRFLLAAVAPTLRQEFHLTGSQYGWVLSAFSLTYAAGAPLLGLLIDRLGLARGASLAVAVWSLAGIATGFVDTLGGLLICRALLGLAESGGIPAGAKAFALYLPTAERPLGSAVSQIGLTIGSVAAPLLARALPDWRTSFVLAGALGFVWIPLWLFTARRIPTHPDTARQPRPMLAAMFGDRRLWGLIAANMLAMVLYSLWTNWTTVYLVQERGLTQDQANGGYAWIPPFFATLGGLCGGWLSLRAARRGADVQAARLAICLGSALLLLGSAVIPLLPSAAWATAGICASFFLTVCLSVNVYAMPLDLFGPGRAAFAVSLLTSAYGVMQTVVSPLIDVLVSRYGFRPVCAMAAVLPLAAVGVLWATGVTRRETA